MTLTEFLLALLGAVGMILGVGGAFLTLLMLYRALDDRGLL